MPKTAEAIQLIDTEKNIVVHIEKASDGTMWQFTLNSKQPRSRAEVRRVLTAFLADLTETPDFAILDRHMRAGPALVVPAPASQGVN